MTALRSHAFYALTKYAIVIFCAFGTTGCLQDEPETWEIVILVDTTSENCKSASDYAEKLLTDIIDFGDDYGNIRTGCNIKITPVNGQLYRPDFTVNLKTAPSFAKRVYKKRKEEVNTFFDTDLPTALSAVCNDTGDTSRTFLYHAIHTALADFENSTAEKRFCILFSDAIENGDVSFYNHRKNPDELKIYSDSLRTDIQAHYDPLPNLHSLDFILVHTPAHKDQHLFENSRAFLKNHIEQSGGHFKFKKHEGKLPSSIMAGK
jgi:hypothetical protein